MYVGKYTLKHGYTGDRSHAAPALVTARLREFDPGRNALVGGAAINEIISAAATVNVCACAV